MIIVQQADWRKQKMADARMLLSLSLAPYVSAYGRHLTADKRSTTKPYRTERWSIGQTKAWNKGEREERRDMYRERNPQLDCCWNRSSWPRSRARKWRTSVCKRRRRKRETVIDFPERRGGRIQSCQTGTSAPLLAYLSEDYCYFDYSLQ